MQENQDTTTEEPTVTLMEESLEELKQMRIVKWVDRMLGSRHGLYLLPLIVLIDTYLLILPLEPILAVYAIKNKRVPLWVIVLVSGVVSLLGYLSLYAAGYYFSGGTLSFFENYIGLDQINEAGELLKRTIEFNGASVNIASLFAFTSALASLPIPLSVFTFSVGVFKVAIVPFTVMFFVGRTIRYYLSAWVGRKYGVAALEAVFKNVFIFALFLFVSIGLLAYKLL